MDYPLGGIYRRRACIFSQKVSGSVNSLYYMRQTKCLTIQTKRQIMKKILTSVPPVIGLICQVLIIADFGIEIYKFIKSKENHTQSE